VERIKEAIEKAKAGRRTDQSTSRPADEVEVDATAGVDKITYRQTKVIQLDPLHLEEKRIISYSKNDPRSMSFDMLRTQVLRKMQENKWRTLAVTSPTAECGKTVVSINLALSIAQQTEQTVLLADFDLRKPKISDYLGLPSGLSLVDYLEGDASLADVFVNPGVPRLTLLPNKSPIKNASETLTTTRMKALVTDIRDRYESRMIIFDLPPVLTTDDAMAFLPQVDCAILVVANGASTTSDVKEASRLLQSTNLLGVMLNKSEEESRTYY